MCCCPDKIIPLPKISVCKTVTFDCLMTTYRPSNVHQYVYKCTNRNNGCLKINAFSTALSFFFAASVRRESGGGRINVERK